MNTTQNLTNITDRQSVVLLPRWLKPARALVLAALTVLIGMYLIGLPFYFRLVASLDATTMPDPGWTPDMLRAAQAQLGMPREAYAAFLVLISFGVAIVYALMGLLIFWRKSDGWFGLYLAFQLVLFGTQSSNSAYGFAQLVPAARPIISSLGNLGWMLLPLILYTFPDGRFVPRWGRWVFAGWLLALGVFILMPSNWGSAPDAWALLLLLVCFGTGIAGQVYRYLRISDAVQQQQTKWVMAAMAQFFGLALLALATLAQNRALFGTTAQGLLYYMGGEVILLITSALIPLSIAIAIFRFRLWDIDLIIRRTLIYGVITAMLGLSYLGSVVLLQQLFRGLTGQGSDLAIIISTLAIAALFVPLRNRVQLAIDHRFYRRKYDATHVLASFSETVRDEVDLNRLTDELLGVVEETLQPQQVSLWLREANAGRSDRTKGGNFA